jgi:GTP pyrophosphokinase
MFTQVDIVLGLIKDYAPAEVEAFREFLGKVMLEAKNLDYAATSVPTPVGVGIVLASWKVPVPLIKVALCAAAIRDYQNPFIYDEIPVAYQSMVLELVRFSYFLAVKRKARDKAPLDLGMYANIWSEEFKVLLLAIFYETLRVGATRGASDKEMLVFQERQIFRSLVADQFGIWTLHREMKDLVYRCENPEGYLTATQYIDENSLVDPFIRRVKEIVYSASREFGKPIKDIYVDKAWPYKIGRLLEKESRLNPNNCVSFVLIFDSEEECHDFVRVLHSIGDPNKSNLRDYISVPKPNGYRSIHLGIDIPGMGMVRFYLRTKLMHEVSQFGILHRWKEEGKLNFDKTEFLSPPSIDSIFVYSQDGAPHVLPEGSGPLDLAYLLSEEFGHCFEKARIIGRRGYVHEDYKIKSGDIVIIYPGPRYGPHVDWIKKVRIPEAKEAIAAWFDGEKSRRQIKRQIPVEDRNPDAKFISSALIVPPQYANKEIRLCRRCRPYPPDSIVAYSTMAGSVTVHRSDCPIAMGAVAALPLDWRESHFLPSNIVLEIDAWDRLGLLRDITEEIWKAEINISESVGKSKSNGTVSFTLHLLDKDIAAIDRLVSSLSKITHVVDVRRSLASPKPFMRAQSPLQVSKLKDPYSSQAIKNKEVFFGRANELFEIQTMLEGVGRNNSVILWGQQRIGKTSLLYQLQRVYLESYDSIVFPIYVSLQGGTNEGVSCEDWINRFGRRISKQLIKLRIDDHCPSWDEASNCATAEGMITFVEDLMVTLPGHQVVILIDEAQGMFNYAAHASKPLVQALNYLVDTQARLAFVFSGWGLIENYQTMPENMLLFGRSHSIPLSVLDPSAAEELIRKPLYPHIQYEDKVVQKILDLTRHHPYYIHRLCSSMVQSVIRNPMEFSGKLNEIDLEGAVERMVDRPEGESNFFHLLEAIPEGYEILRTIARMTVSEEFVARNRLLPALEQRGIREPEVEKLIKMGIIESNELGDAYRIFLPLLRLWLLKNS